MRRDAYNRTVSAEWKKRKAYQESARITSLLFYFIVRTEGRCDNEHTMRGKGRAMVGRKRALNCLRLTAGAIQGENATAEFLSSTRASCRSREAVHRHGNPLHRISVTRPDAGTYLGAEAHHDASICPFTE